MSVALRDYASWQHPFREQRIYVRSAIIHFLASEALHSLKAQHVAEIGGILWGTRPSGPDDPVVIEDAELVPSEGRLYNATPADASNVVRALRNRNPGSDFSCLGYFRSSIHDDLRLTPRDQELIEKEIRDPDAVFLVIKPFDIGVCMAGFFFWEDGHLQTEVSDLEVPFVVTETSKPVTETSKPKDSVEPDAVEDAAPEPPAWPVVQKSSPSAWPVVEKSSPPVSEPEPQIPPRKTVPKPPIIPNGQPELPIPRFASSGNIPAPKPGRSRWWVGWPLLNAILGLVLLALAGTLTYWIWSGSRLRRQASHQGANSPIGLRVFRASDGQLNVGWNGNAPLIANAQRGKLTITDGKVSHELDLDPSQLRSSGILYMPSGADVQFKLDVYSKANQSAGQTIRVLSSELAPGRNGPLGTAPATLETQSAQSKVPEKRDNPAAAKLQTPAKPKSHDQSKPAVVTKSQQPAALSKRTTNVNPERKIPPKAALKADQTPDARKLTRSLPPPPPRTQTQQNPNPVAPPRQPEQTPNSPPAIAVADGRKRAIYVPPQPLQKLMPDTTSIAGLTIDQDIQITVHVKVDSTGHVVEARLSDADFNFNSALAQASLTAARQWVFQPATLDGKAVLAEHIIVFKFHP